MVAAANGTGEGEVPEELRMAWWCQSWNTMPDSPTSLYDQDYRLIYRMQTLNNIYNAVQHYVNAGGKKIHNLSESERKLLRWLMDMGIPIT